MLFQLVICIQKVVICISYTPEQVMVSLLLHETNEQGYHMSEWGITCLSPTKLVRLYLFVTKGVS